MRLYELDDRIEKILSEHVDRETGEIGEEALVELEALEMERDAKALAVARYLLGEKAEAEAVKTQADRLARRAQRHANRAERLKGYLASHLPAGHKLRDDVVEIGWRRSEVVEIENAEGLPEAFVRVKREADKASIRKALKSGEKVPGATLLPRMNLQVK